MIFIMVGLIIFTLVAIFVVKRTIAILIRQDMDAVGVIKDQQEKLLNIKKSLDHEQRVLEEQVAQIFALYNLTREMTKSFSESKTFQAFKTKLSESVSFTDCLLLDPLAQQEIVEKQSKGYWLWTLTGQRRNLGVLAVSGVADDQRAKMTILANQFALALRRVRLYQDIEQLAITDSLTEVHTRRHVMERLEEERSRAYLHKANMAFLMIDIDFFKSFNDQYGHLAGDQILREISLIIKANIREIDIIGRYGGEEFCVVLPDTDYEAAVYVAERIRAAVEAATIKAYDTMTKATVSIGIAVYAQDGNEINELIDKADWALYRAKKEGRNRVCAFGVYQQ